MSAVMKRGGASSKTDIKKWEGVSPVLSFATL
jgi:hypothetical protein